MALPEDPEPGSGAGMHPQLLGVTATAGLLRMRAQAVRSALEAGDIPGTKVGREWRVWAPAVVGKILGEQAVSELTSLPAGFHEPVVVGVVELSALLGLHQKTVTRMLRGGELPGQKVGHVWRSYWPTIRDRIAAGLPISTPVSAPVSAPTNTPASAPVVGDAS